LKTLNDVHVSGLRLLPEVSSISSSRERDFELGHGSHGE